MLNEVKHVHGFFEQLGGDFAGVLALGVAAAAEEFPRRPLRMIIGLPHSSQSMSVVIVAVMPLPAAAGFSPRILATISCGLGGLLP